MSGEVFDQLFHLVEPIGTETSRSLVILGREEQEIEEEL